MTTAPSLRELLDEGGDPLRWMDPELLADDMLDIVRTPPDLLIPPPPPHVVAQLYGDDPPDERNPRVIRWRWYTELVDDPALVHRLAAASPRLAALFQEGVDLFRQPFPLSIGPAAGPRRCSSCGATQPEGAEMLAVGRRDGAEDPGAPRFCASCVTSAAGEIGAEVDRTHTLSVAAITHERMHGWDCANCGCQHPLDEVALVVGRLGHTLETCYYCRSCVELAAQAMTNDV